MDCARPPSPFYTSRIPTRCRSVVGSERAREREREENGIGGENTVGNGRNKARVLAQIQTYLAERGVASAREIATFINDISGRGVTVAQVSNFLAADRRFRKASRVRITNGVRGGAIWLWELVGA